MVRRLKVLVLVAAVVVGLAAPTPASAAPDPDYGWNYLSVPISGTYTMLRGQFAGDSATDLLFYAPGSAPDSLWIGRTGVQGSSGFTRVALDLSGNQVPLVGDFAGDDYDDLLLYGRGTIPDVLLTSVDTSDRFSSKAVKISGTTYQPKVLLDYRGVGGKDDVLFLGPGDVPDYLWHFTDQVGTPDYEGPGTYQSRTLRVNGSYQLVVADYSGDFLDDVVLYQPGTKADYKWVSTASGAFVQTNLTINGTYQPVPVRHQEIDGIFWWASGSANEAYWTSNGTSFTSRPVEQYPWMTGTARPFGGNGVLIQSDRERDLYVRADEKMAEAFYLANPNHDFGVATQVATGDFDGDDTFDSFWYGPGSRPDEAWYGLAAEADPRADALPEADVEKVTPFTER